MSGESDRTNALLARNIASALCEQESCMDGSEYIYPPCNLLGFDGFRANIVSLMAYRMPTQRSSRSQTLQEYLTPYSQLVQSCAIGYPGSKAFYDQLVDYVKQAPASLQDPFTRWKAYRISLSDSSSKRLFPTSHAVTVCDAADVPPAVEACSMRVVTDPSRNTPDPNSHPCPHIVLVDGFLSPNSVDALGMKFRIRPELFISHLDFTARNSHESFAFATSNLPSSQITTVQLRMVSIGSAQAGTRRSESLDVASRLAKSQSRAWRADLLERKEDQRSIIRDIHLHNQKTFSLEHLLSISFAKDEYGCWIAVILLDGGIPTNTTSEIPWKDYCYNGHPPHFLPIIPFNLSSMRPTENKVNTASPNVVSSRTFELSDMLENLSASQLQVLTQTPELLVLKLMSISSISYNQLLNVIADNVAAQTALTSSPEHHQQSGEQLQSLAVLLERTHVTINEHYNLINQGSDQATAAGNGPYPVNLSQAVNHELVRTRSSVQGDLEHLMRRCLQIQGEARTTSDALMRAGQLLQTQGSEEQTREINNLTRVAFVFLPLSFVASIFGMNVAQLAGNPPIWIFFATAVPCTLATFMIAKWDSIMSWLMRRWENRGKN